MASSSHHSLSDHRFVVGLCSLALAFVLGGLGWAYFALHQITKTPLILHFNDLGGITSVGGFDRLVFVAIFGALISLMNGFIALEFDARGGFLGKFLAVITLFFGVLLFIAFAAIINANV
jgi:hypothetical protein